MWVTGGKGCAEYGSVHGINRSDGLTWHLSMAAAAVVFVLVGRWAAARPEPSVPTTSPFVQTQALEELVQQSGFPAAEAALPLASDLNPPNGGRTGRVTRA